MKTLLSFFLIVQATVFLVAPSEVQANPQANGQANPQADKGTNKQQEYIRALTPPSRNLIVNSVAPAEKPAEKDKAEAHKADVAKPQPATAAPPTSGAPPKAESSWKPSWQPDYQKANASIDLAIQFEFNSNRIKHESMKMLEDLAVALNSKALQEAHFLVEGHTDGVGSSAYNLRLSQLRADQVKNVLVRKKVAASRLKSQGKGFSEPLNANDIQSPENRRVRIISMEK